jgi:hypothetical protein
MQMLFDILRPKFLWRICKSVLFLRAGSWVVQRIHLKSAWLMRGVKCADKIRMPKTPGSYLRKAHFVFHGSIKFYAAPRGLRSLFLVF